MKDTDYAYAVARIRANETSLLTTEDIELLITADNDQSALHILEEKGWIDAASDENLNLALKQQVQKTWQLLCEVSPDISELEFLIVKNDFHNIKAALKELVSDTKDSHSFLVPSIIDPAQIRNAIFNKKFFELPGFARDCVEKTYDVLARTSDGQLADIMIDAMTLDSILEKAQNTHKKFIIDLAELLCVTANIKTALRAARTGKDKQFLETALCQTKTLDKSSLVEAAAKDPEELISFISGTAYSEASAFIRISSTAFEKWCDDILMLHIENARFISFGVEPLIAYYIAKDAEIKTVRIILSCKHNKLSNALIKERVRKLYV